MDIDFDQYSTEELERMAGIAPQTEQTAQAPAQQSAAGTVDYDSLSTEELERMAFGGAQAAQPQTQAQPQAQSAQTDPNAPQPLSDAEWAEVQKGVVQDGDTPLSNGVGSFMDSWFGQGRKDAMDNYRRETRDGGIAGTALGYLSDLGNSFWAGLIGGGGKIAEAAGHLTGSKGLVQGAKDFEAGVNEYMPTDMTDTAQRVDENGNAVDRSWGQVIADEGKNVFRMSGEFAPVAIPGVGPAYKWANIVSGGVNRYNELFKDAKDHGLSNTQARIIAGAGGAIDAAINAFMMNSFSKPGAKPIEERFIKSFIGRQLAGAAKTAGLMGVSAGAQDFLQQKAENGDFDIERTGNAVLDAAIKGALFHVMNEGLHAPIKWSAAKAKRAQDARIAEMEGAKAEQSEAASNEDAERRAALAAQQVLEDPLGAAKFIQQNQDAALELIDARRRGRDVDMTALLASGEDGIPFALKPAFKTQQAANAFGDRLVEYVDSAERQASEAARAEREADINAAFADHDRAVAERRQELGRARADRIDAKREADYQASEASRVAREDMETQDRADELKAMRDANAGRERSVMDEAREDARIQREEQANADAQDRATAEDAERYDAEVEDAATRFRDGEGIPSYEQWRGDRADTKATRWMYDRMVNEAARKAIGMPEAKAEEAPSETAQVAEPAPVAESTPQNAEKRASDAPVAEAVNESSETREAPTEAQTGDSAYQEWLSNQRGPNGEPKDDSDAMRMQYETYTKNLEASRNLMKNPASANAERGNGGYWIVGDDALRASSQLGVTLTRKGSRPAIFIKDSDVGKVMEKANGNSEFGKLTINGIAEANAEPTKAKRTAPNQGYSYEDYAGETGDDIGHAILRDGPKLNIPEGLMEYRRDVANWNKLKDKSSRPKPKMSDFGVTDPSADFINNLLDGASRADRIRLFGFKPAKGSNDGFAERLHDPALRAAFDRYAEQHGASAALEKFASDMLGAHERYGKWSSEKRTAEADRKAENEILNERMKDLLKAEKDENAEWDAALGEIESGEEGFGANGEYVIPFSRARLSQAKRGDIIRFGKDRAEFTLRGFDPESGVMEVVAEGEGAAKPRFFEVSENGVKEVKNGRSEEKPVQNDDRDENGERRGQGDGGEGGEGGFQLESATPEQLEAERVRRQQREEIARRQAQPIKGGGEYGQTLMDLGGAEGEDLFNRTVPARNEAPAKPETDIKALGAAAKKAMQELRSMGAVDDKTLASYSRQWRRQKGDRFQKMADAADTVLKYREAVKNQPPSEGGAFRGKAEDGNDTRYSRTVDEAAKEDPSVIDRIANRLGKLIPGVKVKIAEMTADERAAGAVASYDRRNATATFSPDANLSDVVHEIGGHAVRQWAERNSPELLRKAVEYARNAPKEIKDYVYRNYADRNADGSFRYDGDALLDEIFAHRFAREHGEEFRRMLEEKPKARKWWANISNAVRSVFQSAAKRNGVDTESLRGMDAEAYMKGVAEQLVAGKEMNEWTAFGRDMRYFGKANDVGGGENKRYSVSKVDFDNWNNILDEYESGSMKNGQRVIVQDNTPVILKRLGAPDLPITIDKQIIDKITGAVKTKSGEWHRIPVSELRGLQIEMDNPIAVFDSTRNDGSFVILTRMIDRQNNEKAVVVLKTDVESGAIRVNPIASSYGKNKNSIENWTAFGRLLYINKQARKSSARWLQLPSDSDLRARSVLTEKDFSGEQLGEIIAKPDGVVNNGRNKNESGDQRGEIADSDGNPMRDGEKMYSRRAPRSANSPKSVDEKESFGTKFRRAVQDNMIGWRNFQDETGGVRDVVDRNTGHTDFRKSTDFYEAKDRQNGYEEKDMRALQNTRDRIDEALVDADVSNEDFGKFLALRHAEERNRAIAKKNGVAFTMDYAEGAGISSNRANQMLNAMRADPAKFAALDKAGNEYDAMMRADLDRRLASGRISQEDYNNLSQYKHYAPLRRDQSSDALGMFNASTGGMKKNEFIGAKGLGADHLFDQNGNLTVNPYEFGLVQAQEGVKGSLENESRLVLKNLVEHANANGNTIGEIVDGRAMPRGAGYTFEFGNGDRVVADSGYNIAGNRRDVVLFKEGGQLKAIRMDAGENGNGLKLADTANGKDMAKWHKALEWIPKLTRTMAAMRTQYVPTFIARNFKADTLEAMTAALGRFGVKDTAAIAKDMVKAEVSNAKDLKAYIKDGTLRGYVKEAVEGGLLTKGGTASQGFDDMVSEIKSHRAKLEREKTAWYRRGTVGNAKQLLSTLGETISFMNEFAENSTRIGMFTALRKRGVPVNEAIKFCRDATTNFNRHGWLTPYINGAFMFSNAATQGMTRNFQAVKDVHGRQLVGTLIALGTAEALVNHYFGNDDDRENEGQGNARNLSEYEKKHQIGIPLGGGKQAIWQTRGLYATIPYLARTAVDAMLGETKVSDAMMNVLSEAGDILTEPLSGNGVSSKATAMQSISPTLVDPLVQWVSGKDYKGDDRIAKSFDPNKPLSWNGKGKTSDGYKWFAKLINSATGGNEGRKGLVDMAPEDVQLIVETLVGGVGRDISQIGSGIQTARQLANGEAPERVLGETAFARDWVREYPKVGSRYYSAVDRLAAMKTELASKKTYAEKSAFVRDNPLAATNRMKVMEKMEKSIRDYQALGRGMSKDKIGRYVENPSISAESKKRYNDLAAKMMARFVKEVERED